jgi:hypothetical protein
MSNSGISRRMVLVGTDVSEERIASNFRVKTINEVETLAIASDCSTLGSISSFIVFTLKMEAVIPLLIVFCKLFFYFCRERIDKVALFFFIIFGLDMRIISSTLFSSRRVVNAKFPFSYLPSDICSSRHSWPDSLLRCITLGTSRKHANGVWRQSYICLATISELFAWYID